MSENALYYTLSTIAQTLAAAFGVLTAIVIVRLPAVENAVENAKMLILSRHGPTNYEAAWMALREHGMPGYAEAGFNVEVTALTQLAAGHRAWLAWGRLINAVRVALIPTGVDLAACFFALPAVPWLACRPAYAWTTVVLTVVLGVFCLASYGWVIVRLVGRRAP